MYVHPTTIDYKGVDCVLLINRNLEDPYRSDLYFNDYHTGERVLHCSSNVKLSKRFYILPSYTVLSVPGEDSVLLNCLINSRIIAPPTEWVSVGNIKLPICKILTNYKK